MQTITSASAYYSGTVVLPSELNWPDYLAWDEAADNAKEYYRRHKNISETRLAYLYLPAILQIVKEWNIAHLPEELTVDTFPLKPVKELAGLIAPIMDAVNKMVKELNELPNS